MDDDRNYTFPECYNGKNLLHLKALLGAVEMINQQLRRIRGF
jgi:hypothetical protein